MIARTIKRLVRLEWRKTMKQEKFPLETPYIDSFLNFINKFIKDPSFVGILFFTSKKERKK